MARTRATSRADPSGKTPKKMLSTTPPPNKVNRPRRRRRVDPWTPKRKPPKNPRLRPPPPTHFTCRICIDEKPVTQFPRWIPPRQQYSPNTHDVPFRCIPHLARNPRRRGVDPVCKACISANLSARLDIIGARLANVGCLEVGCEEVWSWEYTMRYMPRGPALEKYNVEMMEVWRMMANPALVTCPVALCGAIGLPDITAPGYPQVVCHACGARTCAQCRVDWHKGQTCAEVKARRVDQEMSVEEKETLVQVQGRDGKRCPNCQLVIEKDGGCDSMYCMGCKKYFNWSQAASVIPGKTKVLPIIFDQPYWQAPGDTMPCEADALEAQKKGGTVVRQGRI